MYNGGELWCIMVEWCGVVVFYAVVLWSVVAVLGCGCADLGAGAPHGASTGPARAPLHRQSVFGFCGVQQSRPSHSTTAATTPANSQHQPAGQHS